jgi:hypothetical protein
MEYPEFLYGSDCIMSLPKSYLEYFVRWYYYDHSEDTEIPDTIPVENIEDYIAEHLTGAILWQAKGFASAINVSEGDNLDFKNDAEFHMVVHCVTKIWYKFALQNGWIEETITKEEFKEACLPLKTGFRIHL